MTRFLAVLLVGATALTAEAQVASVPDTDSRIRVESSAIVGRRASGTLRAMNAGVVTLGIGNRGTTLVVPWSRVFTVSVMTGRNERTGATIGAMLGGGAALVTWPYGSRFENPENRDGRVALALALPVAGALVGLVSGPEEWEPMTWRPSSDTVMLDGEALRLTLAPDSKLLVRHGKRWVRGRLVSDIADTLTVRTRRSTRALAWSDIAQVNLQESRSRLRGAALWGTLGGVYAIARLARGPESTIVEKQQIIGVSLLAGAAVGAIVGRGTWTRVPIPAR